MEKWFIGTFIKRNLFKDGQKFFVPKNDNNIFLKDLGNVVYAAGITSDFRSKSYDTVNAHVNYFVEVLKKQHSKILFISLQQEFIEILNKLKKTDKLY